MSGLKQVIEADLLWWNDTDEEFDIEPAFERTQDEIAEPIYV